jgi:hypothetical protein
MSEITNLNIKLQSNPHASAIISIIKYLNDPNIRETDSGPFQALAVARILTERSLNWNGGSSLRGNGFNATTACTDGCDPKGGYCIDGWGPCPSPAPCPGEDTCGPSVRGASAVNAIRALAVDSGLEDPYTPQVTAFLSYMEGIDMSAINAYVFFQQIVDEFYRNVSFISFFTRQLKEGFYADGITQLIGGNFRSGFRPTGLTVETVSDGEAGVPTKAVTTIDVGTLITGLNLPFPAPYIATYRNTTTLDVFWINENNYVQPTVDGGAGVTSNYHPVNGISNNQTDNALILEVVINDLGAGYTVNNLGTQLVVDAPVTGSLPATLFNFDSYALAAWNVGYVDGTAGTGANEVTAITYSNATLQSLYGTWFKMYNAANDGYLFYYQEAGTVIDPASFGVAFATAVPIDLPNAIDWNDCPTCITAQNEIENRTEAAIVGTGAFRVGTRGDGCCTAPPPDNCSLIDDGNGNVIANPNCKSTYVAQLEGDWANAEGGTSSSGVANQVNDVIAPDGTVFATDIIDDLEYARIWNANVPAHMAKSGIRIHYLKPAIIFPCICCIQSLGCPAGCIFIDCPDYTPDYDTASIGSIMIQTTYPAITEDLKFNIPGTTTQAIDWNDCPTCLM